YHDIAVLMVNLQVAIAKPCREPPGLCFGARGLLGLRSGLLETIDRLEAAVGLDHGQEHLIRAPIVGGAVGELEAAEIQGAGFLHGLDQGLPCGIAADLFQCGDDRTANQVALQRDEAWQRPITGIAVSFGKGTTCVITTPAPAGPSSLASASEPTKEIFTKVTSNLICLASLMNSAAGL